MKIKTKAKTIELEEGEVAAIMRSYRSDAGEARTSIFVVACVTGGLVSAPNFEAIHETIHVMLDQIHGMEECKASIFLDNIDDEGNIISRKKVRMEEWKERKEKEPN